MKGVVGTGHVSEETSKHCARSDKGVPKTSSAGEQPKSSFMVFFQAGRIGSWSSTQLEVSYGHGSS